MEAHKLQPHRSERVYSVLQIAIFSIIVFVMLLFLVLLIYQWYTRPAAFTTVAAVQQLSSFVFRA